MSEVRSRISPGSSVGEMIMDQTGRIKNAGQTFVGINSNATIINPSLNFEESEYQR